MASLEQILSFAAAARHGSFAAAARELGLSASAVAKSIARWEDDLGVRLFQRTTRRVVLTVEGEQLLARCQRIMDEVEALESSAAGARAQLRGVLRVDTPIVYGRQVVLPVLMELAACHPQLELDLRFSDRFADLIQEGLDAVVRVGPLADSALVARTFDQQVLLTCASPAYLESRGTPGVPEQLRQHDCLLSSKPTDRRCRLWQFTIDGQQLQWQPPARIRMDDGEALVVAAVAGSGIVQVPDYMVQADIDCGRLTEVLAPFRPRPMPISVVYPSNRQVPPRTKAFVDLLVQHAASRRQSGRQPPAGPTKTGD